MNNNHNKNSLGTRMKTYESVSRHTLMRRTPVILRLDGKAFHTFTKFITPEHDTSLFNDPFSKHLHWVMTQTMQSLCDNIQNARFGYTQSDEISILLTDWTNTNTDQWFDGNLQKITSVAASMATAYFNYYFRIIFPRIGTLAFFDCRAFNIPREEAINCFIWRQQDASRNSIQMLGHFHFSHNQMQGKNNSQIQDMLMLEKNINWNNIATWKKRGSCYHPINAIADDGGWLDEEIPIFTQDRKYIEQYIYSTEEK